jgi:hypothetical protein
MVQKARLTHTILWIGHIFYRENTALEHRFQTQPHGQRWNDNLPGIKYSLKENDFKLPKDLLLYGMD